MTRLDQLWTLEWEHESNAPLKTKSIEGRAGVLRHIAEGLERCSWTCEITVTAEIDRLQLYEGDLRQIDGGTTSLGYGRLGGNGLVNVVRFAQQLPNLMTGYYNPAIGQTLEEILLARQGLTESGALHRKGPSWFLNVWHPELRRRNLVWYERRGKTLQEELYQLNATGFGRVIAEVLNRPVISVAEPVQGIWEFALADPKCADRFLGQTFGEPRFPRRHSVRVQTGQANLLHRAKLRCANPARLGGGLQLLVDRAGRYVFLDLDILADSRRDLRSLAAVSLTRKRKVSPFATGGAIWSPLQNVTNVSLEGMLTLDLPTLRVTLAAMFLGDGTLTENSRGPTPVQ